MRVLMLSKACIVGIYQRKLEEIAKLGVTLLALVPPSWHDGRVEAKLERAFTNGYTLETLPIVFNGSFHWHFYRGLRDRMRAFRPDIVHIDEEPYNLATWQALFHARRCGAKTLFFSWQNINRRYPLPFAWGERWVLNTVDHAVAGTSSAGQVWREKGYHGGISIIPQFGVDHTLFTPLVTRPQRPFTIGYFGRLVEEKGIQLLLAAAAQLPPKSWQICLVGSGPMQRAIEAAVEQHNIAPFVHMQPAVPSTQMPAYYHKLDALVLPSLTRPNWKEQFGRVLIEAMACDVITLGARSGAIPEVIGDAGLTFGESNVEELQQQLQQLVDDVSLRETLRQKGRQRVKDYYTQAAIARNTVKVYHDILGETVPGITTLLEQESAAV